VARAVRQRKKRLNPLHLTFRQQKYITHRLTSIGKPVESQQLSHGNKLTGPEPGGKVPAEFISNRHL